MYRETNADLLEPSLEKLQELGFSRLEDEEGNSGHVFRGFFHDLNITVELMQEDFMDDKIRWTAGKYDRDSVLLVAGACIADLFHPDLLVRCYTSIKKKEITLLLITNHNEPFF
jgi:hypothetical protein